MADWVLAGAAILGAGITAYSALSADSTDISIPSYEIPEYTTPDYSSYFESLNEATDAMTAQTTAMSEALSEQTSLLSETMAQQSEYYSSLLASADEEAAAQDADTKRRINANKTGRASTLLTGGSGLDESTEPVKKKTLLGL